MLNKKIKSKRNEYRLLVDEQQKMANLLKEEDRNFKGDEEKRFNQIDAELDVLGREINDLLSKEKQELIRLAKNQAPRRSRGAESPADINLSEDDNIIGDILIGLKTGRSFESRAITTSTGSALIQDPFVQGEIIESLLSNNPLVAAGARYFPVQDNHLQFPKIQSYPSVQWMGSGDQLTSTDPSITSVKFDLKDVALLVRVENNVLYDSNDIARNLINRSIEKSINQAILEAVFSGDTNNKQPVGLDGISGVQSYTPTDTTDFDFIVDGAEMLLQKNVPLENIGIIMSPKSWSKIVKYKTGLTGDNTPLQRPFDFVKMRNEGMLHVTTAIGDNYGTGNDEGRIYMGDFSQLAIGMSGPFALNLVEKYSDFLQTGFQVHMRLDVQAYLSDNFVRVEGITYD